MSERDGNRPRRREGKSAGPDGGGIELRFDAVQVGLVALVLVFLGLAYYLFREPPSGTAPAGVGGGTALPPSGQVADADVSEDLTFFDRLESGQRSGGGGGPRAGLQPTRSARSSQAPPAPPVDDRREPVERATRYTVQVFAGEKAAADVLERSLKEKGYPARVVDSGEGAARVRVGRYASRGEAEESARRLSDAEKLRTWVVGEP